ncbi:MAG: ABC transporter permease subunit [Candidatus Poribacteria bacterium]|nr:ABC transporter permease subunit [Candidatus Poribacteria bacterium]
MIWHIAKREILDNLTRFRFALTLILLVTLMVINAVIFVSSKYQRRIAAYSQDTNAAMESLKERNSSLGELAVKGPGNLYKQPSPLGFIATGTDAKLPKRVTGSGVSGSSWRAPNFYYSSSNNWSLEYPQDVFQKNDALPNFTELDWTFIIGLVMSFMAILFTYDAISGERETGTLSLLMSNAVSRAAVLLAKFIGAFLTIMLPLFIGILLNLMIVNASDLVLLDGSKWARVGIIFVISAIYISIFLWLGLFISSQFSNSSSSLLVLLLIWVVFVVLIPNTMGTLASRFQQVPSKSEVFRQKQAKLDEINDRYFEKDRRLFQFGSPSDNPPKIEALQTWADYFTERADTRSKFDDEHLNKQFAQVTYARQITRLSPTSIYKYALESLAGTGFVRHQRFVQQARRYRQQFIDFVKSEDRSDNKSYHVYLVKEGLSQKPVAFNSIPKFSEQITLSITFGGALLDLALLISLALVLFMAASLAFLRSDVK